MKKRSAARGSSSTSASRGDDGEIRGGDTAAGYGRSVVGHIGGGGACDRQKKGTPADRLRRPKCPDAPKMGERTVKGSGKLKLRCKTSRAGKAGVYRRRPTQRRVPDRGRELVAFRGLYSALREAAGVPHPSDGTPEATGWEGGDNGRGKGDRGGGAGGGEGAETKGGGNVAVVVVSDKRRAKYASLMAKIESGEHELAAWIVWNNYHRRATKLSGWYKTAWESFCLLSTSQDGDGCGIVEQQKRNEGAAIAAK